MSPYYIGVDVGTGSARACIIDSTGSILALSENEISRTELKPSHITQSSSQIWESICNCVRSVVEKAKVNEEEILGIGFDATCSLVVVDEESNRGVAVGPDFSNHDQDIMLWMDHRAVKEADEINSTGHKCLNYVGGKMFVEMQLPKIKWLKNNMPGGMFNRCKFYDLPDYLTVKASGREVRSVCSAVCKMGFLPLGVEGSTEGWSREFFEAIDLEELCTSDFSKLGGPADADGVNYKPSGCFVGFLSSDAASEMGLTTNCAVATGLIDAYAGWVGTVAAKSEAMDGASDLNQAVGRLASVAGTSTCQIVMSSEAHFVPGVWGPYKDILFPGYWCSEGGQNWTGGLLHQLLTTHPAYAELCDLAKTSGLSKFDYLNDRVRAMHKERDTSSELWLIKHLFYYGDYNGNRSPIADPNMSAAIIGKPAGITIDDLALEYLAACEFISLQTRQIIDALCTNGHKISLIYMSGGQCRNKLLINLIASSSRLPVVTPRYIDSAVVFGSALLGAAANLSKATSSGPNDYISFKTAANPLWSVMAAMTPAGTTIYPLPDSHPDVKLLDVKYAIFLDMIKSQQKYRNLVNQISL
ncbi:HHR142Cp [Eremothecium sinecaudum]|uniref:HHR142Cp n=1 Tax=Eremothecium sinecaudum TaxID=45286 RepID=A0A0X8HWR4_9SACH|nr:HHR142Cp [Eremothecium sinecaudum]AMD22911.1 HHR142Cp [Eremothecium sinecaudum]